MGGSKQASFIDVREIFAARLRTVIKVNFSFSDPDINLSLGFAGSHLAVVPCHDPRFGDYQSSSAILIAKSLKLQPREVAQQIVSGLKVDDFCQKVEVAGPGFINFHLKPEFVAQQLKAMAEDPSEGISTVPNPACVVIDFSSPNIAKPMHVGHIRSTFLGDALARIAKVVGYKVITVNHLGDWGTQFGKLIYGYKNFLDHQTLTHSPMSEFERLYKEAHALSEKDPQVLQAVRQELAKLQSGDPENTKIWKEIRKQSVDEFKKAYTRMRISFDHELGESFYHSELSQVVEELKELKIARESQGALCIFFGEPGDSIFLDEPDDNLDLKKMAPMIIQKADGAYLYATTDLAAVRYRVREWKADEIFYVTDARQQLHFKQLQAAVQKWVSKTHSEQNKIWKKEDDFLFPPLIVHIIFGSILGPDKKPIKTRTGEPIKLNDLLDEAETRAFKIVEEKNQQLSEKEKKEAAKVIGIGALKYADLCQNRELDYMFDWNKLLALQGNTAPYLIYAYVRIRSIFRNANLEPSSTSSLKLSTPEELTLGKHLIQFNDIIHAVFKEYRPHLLTNYLYELAVKFSKFYEACPVLKAEEPIRSSRFALCDLTARVLKKGLYLLGIETLEKM